MIAAARVGAAALAIVALLPLGRCRRRNIPSGASPRAPPPVLAVEPTIDLADPDAGVLARTVLSDEQLVALAHAPIACPDIGTEQIVGYHHGVPVRMSVRCDDVCPGQEFRVVEYARVHIPRGHDHAAGRTRFV